MPLQQTLSDTGPLPDGDWLEEEILSGRLAPGSLVDLETLADRRRSTRSDMHAVALRLVADGLATLDNAAAVLRIAPVSLADLNDLTATRIVVETEALRQSIALGDAAWEQRVRGAFECLSAVEPLMVENPRRFLNDWEQCNGAFHAGLVSACPLRRLMDFNRRLYKQHQRYRRLAVLGPRGQRDVQAEHLALFEAALARDAETAGRVLTQHIASTVDQLSNGIRDGTWFGSPLAG